MRGDPDSFWAKLERDADNRVVAWHPLADHSADVAACCEALLQHTLIGRRLARLAGHAEMEPGLVSRLAALAALHDVGKFNAGFQARAEADPRRRTGHVREVLALLSATPYPETARLGEALSIEELAAWTPDLSFLVAAIAHHGRPLAPDETFYRPEFWRPRAGLDPFDGIRDLVDRVRSWFPAAFVSGPALPTEPRFQHAFSGALTLADWIGSDATLFPFSEAGEPPRMEFARARAREAMERLGLDGRAARRSLGGAEPAFGSVSEHVPRPAQEEMARVPLGTTGSLVVLEAETGSGKTEAALLHYARLLHAGAVDGMYFALPTRTAATQIHRRVVNAVRRVFPDERARPHVVLAVPGYIPVDDTTGRLLPDSRVLWPEDERDRWRHLAWAAERPKRFLAGAVVVGTIDQVLLSALQVGHSHMRAAALLRHLLIVDEVHASDAYMTRILEAVLERHAAAGGHALLMSATLGSAALARVTRPGVGARPPSLGKARERPYPCISVAGENAIREVPRGASRRVAIELRPTMDDAPSVAHLAMEHAHRGARVLVLRNTVAGAVATQEALEAAGEAGLLFGVGNGCNSVLAPHHARFARSDRLRLDVAIEARFGKECPRGGVVAVATQTVQQSLDLDADFMVTDLCPMDVLLQRLGRLHRHSRSDRPDPYRDARALVLIPGVELGTYLRKDGRARGPHGIGTVYPDLRILEATRRLLVEDGGIETPRDSRRLVEETTHPEALSKLTAELGGPWEGHDNAMTGVALAHSAQAGVGIARWDTPFGDSRTVFPAKDLGFEVSTRLGEGDRIAAFATAISGPFGGPVSELTIPAFLARGAGDDAAPSDVEEISGGARFRFGNRSYLYDRMGIRAWKPEPEEDRADA